MENTQIVNDEPILETAKLEQGESIGLRWKLLLENIGKKPTNKDIEKNKNQILSIAVDCVEVARFVGRVYGALDEIDKNKKKVIKNWQAIIKLSRKLGVKNSVKIWEKLKKKIIWFLREVEELRRVYEMVKKQYKPEGTLLNQFKEHAIFDIIFHRAGNQRPWVDEENVLYGLNKVKAIAERFYIETKRYLDDHFKQFKVSLDADYTWRFAEKQITENTDLAAIKVDPTTRQYGERSYEKLHTFFTHPDNILTSGISMDDIGKKRKSFEITKPEHVVRRRNEKVNLSIELKWGFAGNQEKEAFYDEYAIRYLITTVLKGIAHENIVIQSNNLELLQITKSIDPEIPTMQFGNVMQNNWWVYITPGPAKKTVTHFFKNFKRVRNLRGVDIYANMVPPLEIRGFWKKVDTIEGRENKIYYPFIINPFGKKEVDKDICLKRLLRVYVSGCAGGFIELYNEGALIELPFTLFRFSKYVREFYESPLMVGGGLQTTIKKEELEALYESYLGVFNKTMQVIRIKAKLDERRKVLISALRTNPSQEIVKELLEVYKRMIRVIHIIENGIKNVKDSEEKVGILLDDEGPLGSVWNAMQTRNVGIWLTQKFLLKKIYPRLKNLSVVMQKEFEKVTKNILEEYAILRRIEEYAIDRELINKLIEIHQKEEETIRNFYRKGYHDKINNMYITAVKRCSIKELSIALGINRIPVLEPSTAIATYLFGLQWGLLIGTTIHCLKWVSTTGYVGYRTYPEIVPKTKEKIKKLIKRVRKYNP